MKYEPYQMKEIFSHDLSSSKTKKNNNKKKNRKIFRNTKSKTVQTPLLYLNE